jgi:hypothetical protein
MLRVVLATCVFAGPFVGTTAAKAATFTYDAAILSGADAQTPLVTQTSPALISGLQMGSASRFVLAVSASTTPPELIATKGAASEANVVTGRVGSSQTFVDDAGVSRTVNYGGEMIVKPGTNAPGVVNGRAYSGHAFDQMQARGLRRQWWRIRFPTARLWRERFRVPGLITTR